MLPSQSIRFGSCGGSVAAGTEGSDPRGLAGVDQGAVREATGVLGKGGQGSVGVARGYGLASSLE